MEKEADTGIDVFLVYLCVCVFFGFAALVAYSSDKTEEEKYMSDCLKTASVQECKTQYYVLKRGGNESK